MNSTAKRPLASGTETTTREGSLASGGGRRPNGAAELARDIFGDGKAEETRRPKKKAKITNDDFEIFMEPDPDLQDDVDTAILDYLIYQATEAIIASRTSPSPVGAAAEDDADRKADMVHAWLGLFQRNQRCNSLPDHIKFRLQLYNFLVLFAYRFKRTQSPLSRDQLRAFRLRNARRFSTWGLCRQENLQSRFDTHAELPLPEETLIEHRLGLFKALQLNDPDPEAWAQDFYGNINACISLDDILLLFMEISVEARRLNRDWHSRPHPHWMLLAGLLMLQAVVESCLLFPGLDWTSDCLGWTFGYGHIRPGGIQLDIDNSDTEAIFALFTDCETGEEAEDWTGIREHFIQQLLPKNGEPVSEALKRASSQHPLKDMEARMYDFIYDYHKALPKPDLQQVQEGRIEGLPEHESQMMLERMGLK